ncbi:ribonuclease H-like domain-containing protein [Tanacetum coccineum]
MSQPIQSFVPTSPFVPYCYPTTSPCPISHQANNFVPLYQTQVPGPVHQPVAPLPYFETLLAANNFQATMLPQAFHTMTPQDPSWNMDTGASSHLADNTCILTSLSNSSIYLSVFVGNGQSIPVTHTGHSFLHTSHKPLHLNHILITPNIIKKLIYVRKFTRDNDVCVEFDAYDFSVKDYQTQKILLHCDSTGDLYPVTQQPPLQTLVLLLSFSSTTWHRRLGHPGDDVIRRLESSNLISCNKSKSPALCHACQLGKDVKLPFYSFASSVKSMFEIIHSDIWTSPISSESQIKYYSIFLDHFSHFVWVYPLHKKSDLFYNIVAFRAYVNKQFNVDIEALQCDHRGEYDNTRFHDLFCQNGIQFRFSFPRTSQQNGKSERMLRTINNLIRTLLFQDHIPPSYWVEALNMTAHLLNILPSTAINNEIPFTKLYNQTPTYEHLRVFGCLCYPYVDVAHKLEPRSTPCIFLGYPANHRGYRCLDLKEAVLDEYNALITNGTWVLVLHPTIVNVVRSMWLLKHKFHADGSLSRYKARLVANGRSQQQGIDYDETFSLVLKPATIRTVLSLSVSRDWPIHQLDVKNDFLHGQLSETAYMHQPTGFVDSTKPDYVCHLQKSLYGLNKTDASLFVYHRGSDIAYLLLYVDDIILTASSTALLQCIIDSLHGEFVMTDLGSLNYFLGILAQRTASGLFLSQSNYSEEILEKAHMQQCNPCRTRMDTESKIRPDGAPVADPTLYCSLVGALQYLTFTRPDLSYVVQQVCLYMHDPREPHLLALKRIIRYVRGTLDHGLQLHASFMTQLVAYTNADWAGCPVTRCAEVEYHGVANVVAKTAWIRNLFRELHTPLFTATLVYCDNILATNGSNVDSISSLDAGNLLHLQTNDNNSGPLINLKLTGSENYKVWAIAMKIALQARNKIGFVDGTCTKATYASSIPLTNQWERCNAVVLSWLLGSISDDLYLSQVYSENAAEFLMGLDDVYLPIRSSLLTQTELPDVKYSFVIVCREESHRGLGSGSGVQKPTASAFVSKTSENQNQNRSQNRNNNAFNNQSASNNNVSNNQNSSGFNNQSNKGQYNSLSCKNCGMKGHTIDRCFEIIWYPNGFKRNQNGKTFSNNKGNSSNNVDVQKNSSGMPFTSDQIAKLMSLIGDKPGNGIHANMADLKKENILGTGSEAGGLYVFNTECKTREFKSNNSFLCFNVSKGIWHNRLGHPSDQVMSVLKNRLSIGKPTHVMPCEVCHHAKQVREPFPLSEHKYDSLGDLIHLDLWGPYKLTTRDGSRYFLTVVDDYSRAVWVYLLKTKDEVFDHLVSFIKLIATQFSKAVKVISHASSPNDDGGEPSGSNIGSDSDSDDTAKEQSSDNDQESMYGLDKFVNHTWLSAENCGFVANVNKIFEPKSYEEAALNKNWVQAMNEEMQALYENNTWDLVDLPRNRKAIGSKWVYKTKLKSTSEIDRYKDRLVAKGFNQKEGIDYEETFCPVVKMGTVRCLISLVVQNGWCLFQLDVNNAFLYGNLDEDVYMLPPPGFFDKNETKVCKLKISLYGLKQALKQWNNRLTEALIETGFQQSRHDHSLYTKESGGSFIALLVYVDDIVLTGNNINEINNVKKILSSKFKIKDPGELKYFLGIEHVNLFLPPLPENIILAHKEKEGDKFLKNVTNYQRLVGKLIYLTLTRPYVSYSVHCLSQHMQSHMDLGLRVLRYLKGAPGSGIVFEKAEHISLKVYADSDWAKFLVTRRSVLGYCVIYNGCLVSWKNKKQATLSKSSAEAEYRSMATCELMWIVNILKDLKVTNLLPAKLFYDNSAAIHIAANPVMHEKTNHFDLEKKLLPV